MYCISRVCYSLRPSQISSGERESGEESENGEILEAKQGGDRPPGPLRRPEGGDPTHFRRGNPRPRVRTLPGRRNQQVPEQGDPQGLGQEDGEEVAREGVREARQLPAPYADSIHPRRRPQGRRHDRRPPVQGQEGHRLEGDQEEVRGEVQDRQEQVVLHQAQVLSRRGTLVLSVFCFFGLFYKLFLLLVLRDFGLRKYLISGFVKTFVWWFYISVVLMLRLK